MSSDALSSVLYALNESGSHPCTPMSPHMIANATSLSMWIDTSGRGALAFARVDDRGRERGGRGCIPRVDCADDFNDEEEDMERCGDPVLAAPREQVRARTEEAWLALRSGCPSCTFQFSRSESMSKQPLARGGSTSRSHADRSRACRETSQPYNVRERLAPPSDSPWALLVCSATARTETTELSHAPEYPSERS